jgi:hypothetical protein
VVLPPAVWWRIDQCYVPIRRKRSVNV